jgi:hypothetical protein
VKNDNNNNKKYPNLGISKMGSERRELDEKRNK